MRVLRTPGFARLAVGQSVNAVGNWVAIIAIWGFASFEFDASAADLALLFVALSIPGAVLGPGLGVVIDHLGPRRSLMVANGLGVANALALTQAESYLGIVALALPLGLIEGLATASIDALPPRLVDDGDLLRANAILGTAEDLAMVVGPVVAAVVNAGWGLAGAFLADAATFAVGMASVAGLRLRPAEGGVEEGEEADELVTPPSHAGPVGLAGSVAPVEVALSRRAWTETRQGLGLVRRSPRLRWLLGLSLLTFSIWGVFGVVEPLYVRDVLEASDTTFALLQVVFGVGMVGAGAVMTALGDRAARPRWIALATLASGAAAAAYVGTSSLPVAYAGVFAWGALTAFVLVPTKTLLQRSAPQAAHGRVLALYESLEPASSVMAVPVAAVAAGLVGVQVLGVAGGVVLAVGGILALRRIGVFG